MIPCPWSSCHPGASKDRLRIYSWFKKPHKMVLAKLELKCIGSQVELFLQVAGVEAPE